MRERATRRSDLSTSVLTSKHHQQHLERSRRVNGVWDVGGHQERPARRDLVDQASDGYPGKAVDDEDDRVVGRRVLA